MRHIVFYISIIGLSLTLAFIILNQDVKQSIHVLTVKTTYSYLYHDDQTIHIPFFINDKAHPLTSFDTYESVIVQNETGSKRIELSLVKISYPSTERYLSQDYQQLLLTFEMPYLGSNFVIMDAYLAIKTNDQTDYLFEIGDFYLTYETSDGSFLDWHQLYGTKHDTSFISRIGSVFIPYTTCDKEITSIEIGTHQSIPFMIDAHTLTLYIPYEDALLYDFPVIIIFDDGSIQTIENFRYVIDYELLKESGLMIYGYTIDET